MTVAELNEVYKDILKDLEKAIVRNNTADVISVLSDPNKGLEKEYKDSEGQDFDQVEFVLSQALEKATEALKNAKPAKKAQLANIQSKINEKAGLFANRRTVIKEAVKDPDFIKDAKQRKKRNKMEKQGKKEEIKKINTTYSAIEVRYAKDIKQNNTIIEKYKKIKEKEEILDNLDISIPGNSDVQSQILQEIKSIVSELESMGEILEGKILGTDVKYKLGNNNTALIDLLISAKEIANNGIVDNFKNDTTLEQTHINRFFAQTKAATDKFAETFLSDYENMDMSIEQLNTEIVNLEADNKEIDTTIQQLQNEALVQGIAYEDDGTTLRTESDIIASVLADEDRKKDVESQYTKFEQKMDYYRRKMIQERIAGGMSEEEASNLRKRDKFKVWWQAVWTKKADLQKKYALDMGIGMADTAKTARTARNEAFKQYVQADLSKIDINKKVKDVDKTKAINAAYKKAITENKPGREPGDD